MAVAPVQRVGKGGAAVTSLAIGAGDGWATPTAGNLLYVTGNSDSTITMTTAGFTAGPSVIDGNGAYTWYKESDGTESTITITPGGASNTAMTVCEYSGAVTTLDASNSSTIAGSAGLVTTGASVTTSAGAGLIVGAALIHSFVGADPSGPGWTNSFANQLSPTSGGSGARCTTYVAELLPAGVAGSYSTVCSWTNSVSDRQHIILAFNAAGAAGVAVTGRCVAVATTTATVRKVSPATATAVAVGTARATAVHVAPVTGRAVAVGVAHATVGHSTPATARAVAVATTTAATVKRVGVTAVTTAVATSTAVVVKRVAVSGRCVAVATTTAVVAQPGGPVAVVGRCVGVALCHVRIRRITRRPNTGTTTRPFTGITYRP